MTDGPRSRPEIVSVDILLVYAEVTEAVKSRDYLSASVNELISILSDTKADARI
jgi:hypothetical protein